MNERDKQISALMGILPYPKTWYDTLTDKRLNAIYRRHLPKLVQLTFEQDERNVRERAGLAVKPQSVQLAFDF